MLKLITTSFSAALVLAVTPVEPAYAQDGPAPPTPADQIVVVTACVAREAEFTRAPTPEGSTATSSQLVLVSADAAAPIHGLTGVREQELVQYVGQRIEVTGTLEWPRTVGLVTTATGTREGSVNSGAVGATGITPEGGPAHEPSDALARTVRTGVVSNPGTASADPVYDLAVLPRLNATTFRVVGGTCAAPPRRTTAVVAAAAAAPAAQSRPAVLATAAPEPQPITAVGCLVRQTPSGTARTAQNLNPAEPLALTGASVDLPRAVAGGSAVPGSVPLGFGTGTVPTPVGTAGRAPVNAGRYAFELSAGPDQFRQLAQHVGEQVEIVGIVHDVATPVAREPERPDAEVRGAPAAEGTSGRVEATLAPAHPSAPVQRVTVTSFRALGTCN